MSTNQWWDGFKRRGQYHSLVLDPLIFTKTCLERMHGVQRKERCWKIGNMACGRWSKEKGKIREFRQCKGNIVTDILRDDQMFYTLFPVSKCVLTRSTRKMRILQILYNSSRLSFATLVKFLRPKITIATLYLSPVHNKLKILYTRLFLLLMQGPCSHPEDVTINDGVN